MIELSNIKLNNYTINIKIDELNNTLFVSNVKSHYTHFMCTT